MPTPFYIQYTDRDGSRTRDVPNHVQAERQGRALAKLTQNSVLIVGRRNIRPKVEHPITDQVSLKRDFIASVQGWEEDGFLWREEVIAQVTPDGETIFVR